MNKTLDDYLSDDSWQRVESITYDDTEIVFVGKDKYCFIPMYRNTNLNIVFFIDGRRYKQELINPRNVMVLYYDEIT